MAYASIFYRSFNKHDHKKVVYGAFLGLVIVAFNIYIMLKPDLNPIQTLNLKVSLGVRVNDTLITLEKSKLDHYDVQIEERKSLAKSTSTSSSRQLRTENSKAIPSILESTSTDNLIPKPAHVEDEIAKRGRETSDPKPTDVQKEESKPIQPISRPKGKDNLVPFVPETNKPQAKEEEKSKPICNTSHYRTNVCQIRGDVRINGKLSTVLLALPNTALLPNISSWRIKPYARKDEKPAMGRVREFQVKIVNTPNQSGLRCTRRHGVSGIVFSTGGYSRNHFHDFTDILIPLYLTSRKFNRKVKFLVTNHDPWWTNKYKAILQELSKYEVIDIDKEDEVHCFPEMIVGLKLQKEFQIAPSITRNSMADFRKLLREAYSLKRATTTKLRAQEADKIPRLLVVSRRNSRSFLNEEEILNTGRNLGFEVIIAEADRDEAKFAKIVNSCDVMMGVHGAGLTNIVYLPEKAVFIQIIPLGEMDWIAKTDFGEPAKNMNLSYLEYKINVNESSLIQQYPLNHPVIKDPHSISQKGWQAFKEVYLIKQNVKLDMGRFRETLREALKILYK